jgi:predicted small secreted protein
MTTIQRISAFLLLSALLVVFSTGCSTARGFGRDVGHAGNLIERAAR